MRRFSPFLHCQPDSENARCVFRQDEPLVIKRRVMTVGFSCGFLPIERFYEWGVSWSASNVDSPGSFTKPDREGWKRMGNVSRRAAIGLGLASGPVTRQHLPRRMQSRLPPSSTSRSRSQFTTANARSRLGPAGITTLSSQIDPTNSCGCGTPVVRRANSTSPSRSAKTMAQNSSGAGARSGRRTSRSLSN